jgi:hypothetical protein
MDTEIKLKIEIKNCIFDLRLIYTYIMQMSWAWMYADRRSGDFIKGVHSFLNLAEANKRMVLCVVHAVFVGVRRITLPQRPFTSTCSSSVSCPAIIVGPSMEKEGL